MQPPCVPRQVISYTSLLYGLLIPVTARLPKLRSDLHSLPHVLVGHRPLTHYIKSLETILSAKCTNICSPRHPPVCSQDLRLSDCKRVESSSRSNSSRRSPYQVERGASSVSAKIFFSQVISITVDTLKA
jgi:hypothetical protein